MSDGAYTSIFSVFFVLTTLFCFCCYICCDSFCTKLSDTQDPPLFTTTVVVTGSAHSPPTNGDSTAVSITSTTNAIELRQANQNRQ